MTMLKRVCQVLLPVVVGGGMFAQTTYNIYVSVDPGTKKIVYKHKKKKGAHGHQFALDGDTINWLCDRQNCTAVTVTFKSTAPCATTYPATCDTISTSNIDLALYPYSITVTYNGQPYTEDPDVIVDNDSISIDRVPPDKDKDKNKNKKPAPKKK